MQRKSVVFLGPLDLANPARKGEITMNAKQIVEQILHQQGNCIKHVFFLACGGSLVDVYPAAYFLAHESRTISSIAQTAKEFVLCTPPMAGLHSLAVLCSHGGKTPEVVEAAELAKRLGMSVVTFTHNAEGIVHQMGDYNIVYGWGEETSIAQRCPVQALDLMNELLYASELEYTKHGEMKAAISGVDQITRHAMELSKAPARQFAEMYGQETIIYVLGSGASFANAYGFSICSLMEMMWMHSSYIHSGEFFHGPFEVTGNDPVFLLLMNPGRSRKMDERVRRFLKAHAKKFAVIDSEQLGADQFAPSVADYFAPVMFYYLSCVYREALAEERGHSLDDRRYMWQMPY